VSGVLRLIPDINVLISSVTSLKGPAYELYEAARRFNLLFVLCEQHFDELTRVLEYSQVLALGEGRITPSIAFGLATELHRIGEYFARLERSSWPSCSDRDDWYLLDLLMTSRADGIVTRDRHLLSAGERLNLPIFPPSEWAKQIIS